MANKTQNTKANPPSRHPLEVALDLKRELEQYDKNRDRSVFIKAVRDQFLMTRYHSSVKVEDTRLRALDILISRMDTMSDNMLMRLVENLSGAGARDLELIIGGSSAKAGPLFALQQNISSSIGQSDRMSPGSNPVKDTGELLESLEHIAAYFREKKIIDLKPEKEEKEDKK
jgi:hypothetical protein